MLLALVGFSFTSCKDDEPKMAKAVLASVFSLNYDVQGNEAQEIRVVSDATWEVDAPDWVTVTPTTGTGDTYVTIAVTDNLDGGAPARPRRGEVVFHGNTVASQAVVAIIQTGNKFRDLAPVTATEFYAAADGDAVIVNDLTVVTVTADGFAATDGTMNVVAYTAEKPAVGATIAAYGEKYTDKNGMAALTCDKFTVGGKAATVPAPVDITDKLDSYTSATRTYVTLTGLLDNAKNINVEGATNKGAVIEWSSDINIDALASHNVTVEAFYAGTQAPAVNLVVAKVQDNGLAENVFFFEDFEWLEPWSSQKPAGRTVEDNNPDATAQQLGTNKVDDVSTYDALLAKGYEFPVCCHSSKDPREPKAQVYLQRNYLKFGLTGYYSGLKFTVKPGDNLKEGMKSYISFDWSSQRRGSGLFDPTKLVVIVDDVVFEVPEHGVGENENYRWINARIELGDVVKNGSTVVIRNCDDQWPCADNEALRWFIDNIKIAESDK